jgi:hypothetical protein
MRKRVAGAGVLAAALVVSSASGAVPIRSLDGGGNNFRHPKWGQANTKYVRVAPAHYEDGRGVPTGGPNARYISNRIFNDSSQNLFSENGVTQWGFVWGQFIDHTFGLRQAEGGEAAPIGFDANDPLEAFENDFGVIDFTRTPAAPGTGLDGPRQQLNTVGSYIDASSVYGETEARLEWLRQGPDDGDLSNDSAKLMMDSETGLLPRRDALGNASSAPEMELVGRLAASPGRAFVAGDVRANENIALAATHTLFALEHNRIVDLLPPSLSEEEKFQIARRVVGAEQEFITYNEFLPALGIHKSSYSGYDKKRNAGLSNEFAVVGYRAHSMVHGELEPFGEAEDYSPARLREIGDQGIEVVLAGDEVEFVIPLNLTFGNPDLLPLVGFSAVLAGLGAEPQYKNDEMIDDQLRSVLFQVPVSGNPGCLDGPTLPDCFDGVLDLGAIDIERGRDHGIPYYNDLRRAYGLPPKKSFKAITGEFTQRFPTDDPEIDTVNPIDDPDILDFIKLFDSDGNEIPLGSEAADTEAVDGIRRTTSAARLKAIYGSVKELDAFVGMLAERHVPGKEFGWLQFRIWKAQFRALANGDRFYYERDPELEAIERRYGIGYEHTLGAIIEMNTGADVEDNVFIAPEA